MRLRIGRSVFRKEILQSMLNEFPIFDYEDIQLIPNKCIINSRSEADTTVQFGKAYLQASSCSCQYADNLG